MKKERKQVCSKCGMVLNNHSYINDGAFICYGLLGEVFCKWCGEKENLKSQADKNCERCKGDGYTIYQERHSYPTEYYDDIICPCECLNKIKVVEI